MHASNLCLNRRTIIVQRCILAWEHAQTIKPNDLQSQFYFNADILHKIHLLFPQLSQERIDINSFTVPPINQTQYKSGRITYCSSNKFNYQTVMSSDHTGSINTIDNSLVTDSAQSQTQVTRPLLRRYFSRIQQGAMRGSIFALLASAMGTGMFNIPYRINQIGVIAFFLFVLVSGLFSYLGMYLISRLIIKFNVKSYSEMCERSYGKYYRKVAEFCLIIYPWGITVCFQVIFAKFVMQLLEDSFDLGLYDGDEGRHNEVYTTKGELIRICISVGAILVNLFFILKKEIGILQKVSIIGVLAVNLNVAIIFITFLVGFEVDVEDNITHLTRTFTYQGITGIRWDLINWFSTDGWDAFSEHMQGLASVIFCYVNHQLVFPLVFDLKNPSKRRLDKIFNRVHVTEVIIYSLVGLSGYLLLVEHIDERDINAVVMSSIQTTFMSVGKCLMVVSLFFAVPLNLFPAREVVFESFQLEKSNKNHIVISLLLAFSGTAIAIFFQKVNSYFGLLGGTAGVMMAGAIPAICFYKLKGLRSWKQQLIMAFMGVVSVLGGFGAILSVVVPS